MFQASWLRPFRSAVQRAKAPRARRRPPRAPRPVQLSGTALEDRTLPSVMLTPDALAVRGSNGAVVSNTGAISDNSPGATVTLTASEGAISQSGSGTWSWSETTPAGAAHTGPVTIYATDSQGATAAAEFWLNVGQVFLVTNTGDNGVVDPDVGAGTGTLRQAIVDADAADTTGGPSLIAFAIPTTDAGYGADSPGAFTIQTHSALRPITKSVVIDGYTQAGASPNTLLGPCALGSTDSTLNPQNYGDNAVLKIELDGKCAGDSAGLVLGADHITVQGLVINRFAEPAISSGVSGQPTPNGDVIRGNFLGTDVTGTQALGNGGAEVDLAGSGPVTVGGTNPADRNILSAARANSRQGGYGINLFFGGGAVVQGNFIGTDVTGLRPLGNQTYGIYDLSVGGNTIGGANPGASNVISGNDGAGVYVGTTSTDLFAGNFIGTDVTGTAALPNGYDGGVYAIQPLTFGGPGAGNLVSGNGAIGISLNRGNSVVQANLIGTDVTGTRPLGNAGAGMLLLAGGNTIGGLGSDYRNVVAANGGGLVIESSGNTVQGNFIGTDITGTQALSNRTGVEIDAGANNNIIGGTDPKARNIISGNGDSFGGGGVYLTSSGSSNVPTGNQIEGNYIGTDVTGEAALGNGTDVFLATGSNNVISSNTISASTSGPGVWINSNGLAAGLTSGNMVQGNWIGTDATGRQVLGNAGAGVNVNAGTNTQVTDNVIAGTGVVVNGLGGAYGNQIEANHIGTDADNALDLGVRDAGVVVFASSGNTISGNVVAHSSGNGVELGSRDYGPASNNTVSGNTIALNGRAGVSILAGDGDSVLANSIHDNGGPGIDLGNDGVTPNDSAGHTGPNLFQNFPVLSGAEAGRSVTVAGTLTSQPDATFTLDFYANPTASHFYSGSPAATGFYGEGQYYLGSATVTTNAAGTASFAVDLDASGLPGGSVPQGWVISATATDAQGNTSEFSRDVTAQLPTASPGGPYVIYEGGSLGLDGSGSSDPVGHPLTYSWTINGQANAASGVNPTLSWSQLQALGITDEGGPVAVQLSVDDGHGHVVAAAATLSVLDAPLSAAGLSVNATEGSSFMAALARFNDAGGAEDVTATIAWGDGSSCAGVIASDGHGGFTVSGGHTYAEEGSYNPVVTLADQGGSTATATATVQVADAPLTGTGTSLVAVPAQPLSNVLVATFSDPGSDGTPADYSATITWGDGDTTAGITITPDAQVAGQFDVYASKTNPYALTGSYAVQVTIRDVGGASTAVASTARVSSVAVVPDPIGGGQLLLVGGTPGGDTIVVSPGSGGVPAQATDLTVTINGVAR
jgi:parallel beta-helix repeat protein